MSELAHKYPDIVLLNRRPEIMAVKEVIATEKLHGSNFQVSFPLGMSSIDEVGFGSREVAYNRNEKAIEALGGTREKFPLPHAIAWFQERPELLTKMWEVLQSYGFNDVTIFGEAYGPGINVRGVTYSKGEKMLFSAFDIMVAENFLTYDLFCEVIDKMGLPRVPEVWRGEPTLENFDRLLNQPSVSAKANGVDDPNNLAEGVVIRSNPLLRNVFGEWLIAKHKGAKFSEVAHAPKVKKERELGPVDAFVEKFVVKGRLVNAIGRLGDRGVNLTKTMADMPVLLTEMVADLHKECEAEWPEGVNDKQMMGTVSRALSPLYRELLAEG